MGPERVREWLRLITRDLVAPGLGVFIVIHETLQTGEIRLWLMAIAATFIGYPIADRIDPVLDALRKGKGGKG